MTSGSDPAVHSVCENIQAESVAEGFPLEEIHRRHRVASESIALVLKGERPESQAWNLPLSVRLLYVGSTDGSHRHEAGSLSWQ